MQLMAERLKPYRTVNLACRGRFNRALQPFIREAATYIRVMDHLWHAFVSALCLRLSLYRRLFCRRLVAAWRIDEKERHWAHSGEGIKMMLLREFPLFSDLRGSYSSSWIHSVSMIMRQENLPREISERLPYNDDNNNNNNSNKVLSLLRTVIVRFDRWTFTDIPWLTRLKDSVVLLAGEGAELDYNERIFERNNFFQFQWLLSNRRNFRESTTRSGSRA